LRFCCGVIFLGMGAAAVDDKWAVEGWGGPGIHSERGGFTYDLCRRNAALTAGPDAVAAAPKAVKTGTTICGCLFDGGVVLGADTRATGGDIVFDKNCMKIHYIAPNIYCCGAGTAADCDQVTRNMESQLELHRLNTNRESRVVTVLTMLKQMLFRYQGHVGAALIIGGYDVNGPHLHSVAPHGSSDTLPYATMGSGSLAAMSIFESEFKEGMTEEQAKQLVAKAIRAGIFNDLGSGSNVDLCVIKKGKTDYLRGYEFPVKRSYRREKGFSFPPGTTAVLSETVKSLKQSGITLTVEEGDRMET